MVPEQKDEMEENCKLFFTMLMMMMNGGDGVDVVVDILYEARPG